MTEDIAPVIRVLLVDDDEDDALLTRGLLAEGRFQIWLQGLSNQQPYAVEISTNLTNGTVLASVAATNSSFIFTDGPATLPPQRFYRVRWDP